MIKPWLLAATVLVLPTAGWTQDRILHPHAQSLDVLMHVTPPGQPQNIVVAAHLTAANGEASGDDDLGVMQTGKPIVEVQKDGVRIGVLVQMQDVAARPIGALGLMYPYHQGDDQNAVLRRSLAIRDQLAHEIPSRSALFE
jgi:hypothetical protein